MSKSDSFYKYSSDTASIMNDIMINDGELSDENAVNLGKISALLKDKVDSCAEYMSYVKDSLAMKKARLDDVKKAYKIEENKLERLKNYYIACIEIASTDGKLSGDMHSMTLTKPMNKVEIVNLDSIPARFLEIKKEIKPMKKNILIEWKANQESIPGIKIIKGEKGLKIK